MKRYTALITTTHFGFRLPCSYFTENGAIKNSRRMVECMKKTDRRMRNEKITCIEVYEIPSKTASLADGKMVSFVCA